LGGGELVKNGDGAKVTKTCLFLKINILKRDKYSFSGQVVIALNCETSLYSFETLVTSNNYSS